MPPPALLSIASPSASPPRRTCGRQATPSAAPGKDVNRLERRAAPPCKFGIGVAGSGRFERAWGSPPAMEQQAGLVAALAGRLEGVRHARLEQRGASVLDQLAPPSPNVPVMPSRRDLHARHHLRRRGYQRRVVPPRGGCPLPLPARSDSVVQTEKGRRIVRRLHRRETGIVCSP